MVPVKGDILIAEENFIIDFWDQFGKISTAVAAAVSGKMETDKLVDKQRIFFK
jgi:hypothetical protein